MPRTGLLKPRTTDVNIRSGPQMYEYRSIVARISGDRPGRLLDWGCGWGQVTDLLTEAGVDVTSFDYSAEADPDGLYPLEKFPQYEAYLSAEPVQLPYETGEFDAVMSCGVLEHVHDPEGSLDEIRRVLRPGGTLYVYKLPNRYSYLEKIAKWGGLYYHGAEPNDRIYNKRQSLALLARHGFTVTEFRRTNMLPLTLAHKRIQSRSEGIWKANRALAKIPGLNLTATNLELVASSPS